MEALIQIYYTIATALLMPVMVVLLALLVWVLVALGGFVREAWGRRASSPAAEDLLEPRSGHFLLARFGNRASSLEGHPRELTLLVDEIELDVSRRLSLLGVFARVGPMVGLMGTLIPLGPALIGLSGGRIDLLASNLFVAFSTTVVGLLSGSLCYAMHAARRQWYASGLARIEYVSGLLKPGGGL